MSKSWKVMEFVRMEPFLHWPSKSGGRECDFIPSYPCLRSRSKQNAPGGLRECPQLTPAAEHGEEVGIPTELGGLIVAHEVTEKDSVPTALNCCISNLSVLAW